MTEFWGKCELLGHLMLAGRVSEVEMFGGKLGRCDVPQEDGSFVTNYFGASSVYRISVISEAVARELAQRVQPPVHAWDWPKQQPALPAPSDETQGPSCGVVSDDDYDDPNEDHEPPF